MINTILTIYYEDTSGKEYPSAVIRDCINSNANGDTIETKIRGKRRCIEWRLSRKYCHG